MEIMNCYDKAIENLKLYESIPSVEVKDLLHRVKLNLIDGKQYFTMEAELENKATDVLRKIDQSNRSRLVSMEIIVEEFFDVVRTPEGKRFSKCGVNSFKIEAGSGTYFFEITCDTIRNEIILRRKIFGNTRKPKNALLTLTELPSLQEGSAAEDVRIVATILKDMLKEFKRTWKWLKVEQTPSHSSSMSSGN